MKFNLTQEEYAKVQRWLEQEIYPVHIAHQRNSIKNPTEAHVTAWELGFPYQGAIGGGLTYEFTPTSIGVITVAKYPKPYIQKWWHKFLPYQREYFTIDVTDYGSW